MAKRVPPIDPNGYLHVVSRGVYGRALFLDDGERELFLSLYRRWSSKYRWRTLAWVLMGNHHHFLVHLDDGQLSVGMRVLHSGFSRRMHAKYGETRRGHLVRHCFYGGRLETSDEIMRVARYIDLNPVRAGLCERPEDWPWSSYRANLDLESPRPFHDPYALLEHLDGAPREARAKYVEFVHSEDATEDHVLSSDDGYMVESAA